MTWTTQERWISNVHNVWWGIEWHIYCNVYHIISSNSSSEVLTSRCPNNWYYCVLVVSFSGHNSVDNMSWDGLCPCYFSWLDDTSCEMLQPETKAFEIRMEAAQMLLEDSCSGTGQTWGSEDGENTQMTAQNTDQLCESRHVQPSDLFMSLKVKKKKSGFN